MNSTSIRALATAVLAACTLVPNLAFAQKTTENIDPVWQRSNERPGYNWWQTATDGTPNVNYYGTEGSAWTWNTPASSTWSRQDAERNVSWFYTLEGASTANSWFRTTLPAKPGKKLAAFTLTSVDKPGQGIGINDGIYVFVDGKFTGTFASVSAKKASNGAVVMDKLFPTDWRCDDLKAQVNAAGPGAHEIAVAFEEDFGWGGLTRLRVVAEYENADVDGDGVTDDKDTCPSTKPGDVVNASGCSVADLCPCTNPTSPWKNHGAYMACVTKTSKDFIKANLLTKEKGESLVSTAAQSSCGK
jgi:hypothetical protein